MALKGLDIFKLTPKKNCKECGQPHLHGVRDEGGPGRRAD